MIKYLDENYNKMLRVSWKENIFKKSSQRMLVKKKAFLSLKININEKERGENKERWKKNSSRLLDYCHFLSTVAAFFFCFHFYLRFEIRS